MSDDDQKGETPGTHSKVDDEKKLVPQTGNVPEVFPLEMSRVEAVLEHATLDELSARIRRRIHQLFDVHATHANVEAQAWNLKTRLIWAIGHELALVRRELYKDLDHWEKRDTFQSWLNEHCDGLSYNQAAKYIRAWRRRQDYELLIEAGEKPPNSLNRLSADPRGDGPAKSRMPKKSEKPSGYAKLQARVKEFESVDYAAQQVGGVNLGGWGVLVGSEGKNFIFPTTQTGAPANFEGFVASRPCASAEGWVRHAVGIQEAPKGSPGHELPFGWARDEMIDAAQGTLFSEPIEDDEFE